MPMATHGAAESINQWLMGVGGQSLPSHQAGGLPIVSSLLSRPTAVLFLGTAIFLRGRERKK